MHTSVGLLATGLALLPCLAGAETAHRRWTLPDGRTLELDVPVDWRDQVESPDRSGLWTLDLRPSGQGFLVMLTVMPETQNARAAIEQARDSAAESSVEKLPEIATLCGSAAEAWYFSATDRSSAGSGDDYKYLTQALVQRDGRALFMTVLANVEPEAVKASALGMLRGIGCKPANAAAPSRAFELALPDRSWALELDLAGYDIRKRGATEAGGRMVMASNDDSGVTLSAFVEPVDGEPSAPECRKRFWKGAFEKGADADVRTYERGEMALGEYTLTAGPTFAQRHVNGYLAAPGACIDVHVSALGDHETVAAKLERALAGARLVNHD